MSKKYFGDSVETSIERLVEVFSRPKNKIGQVCFWEFGRFSLANAEGISNQDQVLKW